MRERARSNCLAVGVLRVWMVGMDWTAVPVHMIDFEGCTRSGIVEYGVVTLYGGVVTAGVGRVCAPSGPRL